MSLKREYWGPKIWKILHTLAEYSGLEEAQAAEEENIWLIFVGRLPYILPCEICKNHFLEWSRTHSLEGIASLSAEYRKSTLQQYFLDCHNRVNHLHNKPVIITAQLPDLYPRRSLEKVYNELVPVLQLGQQKGRIQFSDVYRWKLSLSKLRAMYGL